MCHGCIEDEAANAEVEIRTHALYLLTGIPRNNSRVSHVPTSWPVGDVFHLLWDLSLRRHPRDEVIPRVDLADRRWPLLSPHDCLYPSIRHHEHR